MHYDGHVRFDLPPQGKSEDLAPALELSEQLRTPNLGGTSVRVAIGTAPWWVRVKSRRMKYKSADKPPLLPQLSLPLARVSTERPSFPILPVLGATSNFWANSVGLGEQMW